MILSIKNFHCLHMCTGYNIKGFYSSCDEFSYDFLPGTYVLHGEIDCGAWAFTDFISKKNKDKNIWSESEVLINGVNKIKKIYKDVCCVDDKPKKPKSSKKSMYQAVDEIAKRYNSSLSAEELLKKFGIPEDVAAFAVRPYSHYYPCYLALVGYVKGYKIFTASWQGQDPHFKQVYINIINGLKGEDCIFIIPSSEKNYYGEDCTYINMYSLFCEELRKMYLGE